MKTVVVKAPGLVSSIANSNAVYIPADNFYLTSGEAQGLFINDSLIGPAITLVKTFRTEASAYIVSGWTNVDIDLLWTNRSAATGNVSWQCLVSNNMEGGAITTLTPPVVTTAAPAQNIIKRTTIVTNGLVSKDQLTGLNLQRTVENVADTLNGPVAVLAIVVRKNGS